MGLGEAVFVQVLNYIVSNSMGDTPESRKIFFAGLGLSICMVIRGRIGKDFNVSNSPTPLAVSQPVVPVAAATDPAVEPAKLAQPVKTEPAKIIPPTITPVP